MSDSFAHAAPGRSATELCGKRLALDLNLECFSCRVSQSDAVFPMGLDRWKRIGQPVAGTVVPAFVRRPDGFNVAARPGFDCHGSYTSDGRQLTEPFGQWHSVAERFVVNIDDGYASWKLTGQRLNLMRHAEADVDERCEYIDRRTLDHGDEVVALVSVGRT